MITIVNRWRKGDSLDKTEFRGCTLRNFILNAAILLSTLVAPLAFGQSAEGYDVLDTSPPAGYLARRAWLADKGVSVDICANISRSVSNELELNNMFEESYTLEVSSPGIDFPLTSERQYNKNVGRQLKIDLLNGERIKGDLKGTDNSGITLNIYKGKKMENEDLFIPFSDIKSSKVLVAFK